MASVFCRYYAAASYVRACPADVTSATVGFQYNMQTFNRRFMAAG